VNTLAEPPLFKREREATTDNLAVWRGAFTHGQEEKRNLRSSRV